MLDYKEFNINPKNRRTTDCTTRAIANVLNISYEQALKEQYEMALKHCYGLCDDKTTDFIMKKYGFEKQKQPRKLDNKKYLVRELDEVLTDKEMKEGVLVRISRHLTVIRNNAIEDIWYCGRKAAGVYYTKK